MMKQTGRPPKIENLPNQARHLRLSRRLTLEQVAAVLDVDYQAVQRYELKGFGLRRPQLYALAKFFEIDVEELDSPPKNFA